jgi:putative FmdB family regulatory protein
MPLYVYTCDHCHASHELLESLSAPVRHDCPLCNSQDSMIRTISLPSFTLNGEGWYKDGYSKGKVKE